MKKTNIFFFALIIAGAISGLTSCTTATKEKKEIGLQLYSIRDEIQKGLSPALDSVAACGYTFVEAANYNDGKLYNMDPAEFTKLVESKGLKFRSSHIGIPAPATGDTTAWNEAMKWWDQAIEAHKAAGVKYVMHAWINPEELTSINRVKEYCDLFNAVGDKCNTAGLYFGFHNHDVEFKAINDTVVIDYMAENVDPEKMFFELDVYWATKGGVKPEDYMNKYPGRFKFLHIKDIKEIGASGFVDFKSVYDAAEKAGVQYCVVEHEAFTYDPYTSLRMSNKFINDSPFVKNSYSEKK